jgi:choline dehydrogenase-like flavoprotein/nucleoside-diphosphate-sugar epimerase
MMLSPAPAPNPDGPVVIVGTGMGGGTLAVLMARAGYRPVLVEAGDETERSVADVSSHGRPFGTARNRALELGGGSNLWHGVTAPLDPEDFLATHPDRHPGWPLSREALMPWWVAAARFMGFREPDRLELDAWPDEVRTRVNDMGADLSELRPKLFRVLQQPLRLKPLLLDLERRGLVTLLRRARARQLEWSPDGRRATAVVVNTDGVLQRVAASRVILAAGALESPVVLLNSAGAAPGQRYNRSGQVGQHLRDHPMAFVGKARLHPPRRAPLFSDMSDGMGHRLRVGLQPADPARFGNSILYLRPSMGERRQEVEDRILLSLAAVRRLKGLRPQDIASLVAHPRVAYRAVVNRYALPVRYRNADLFFVTEQGHAAGSEVRLAGQPAADGLRDADICWQVSEADIQRVGSLFAELIVPALQTQRLRLSAPPRLADWQDGFTSAAHHLGTMRMSVSSQDGVVSPDLLLHGTDNVWVCDGSVFPSVGNANPALTICAMAHRLFSHLESQLKRALLLTGSSENGSATLAASAGGAVRPQLALLTGSRGFIGRSIASRAAADSRLSLRIGVRSSEGPAPHAGQVVIDFASDDSVAAAMEGCDVLVHAAHDAAQPLREADQARRLVLAGGHRGVHRFVFFGSFCSYDAFRERVDETAPAATVRVPYIRGKLDLERCLIELANAHPELLIVMLQPTMVTGPGGSWDRFFIEAARAPAISLPHAGLAPLNTVSVESVAEAAVRVAIDGRGLRSGFHKFLLNGTRSQTWVERIAAQTSARPPAVHAARSGLLAEGRFENALLCLRHGSRVRLHYTPRRQGPSAGQTGPLPADALILRGLSRLTAAGWAEIDAGAARRAGLLD